MHMYKASEWQDGVGRWHVADTASVGTGSSAWWQVPAIFDMSYEAFIHMLVDKYHVDHMEYFIDPNLLVFCWDAEHYNYAHKYLLDVNRIARNKQFKI